MDECCISIPVICNPQIVISTNKSSLYIQGWKKKEMKISCQALSREGFPETLLATPAVERVFAPNGVMAQDVFIMQQPF